MTPAYQYSATVIRWIDGDSVILDIDCGFDLALKGQKLGSKLKGVREEYGTIALLVVSHFRHLLVRL